MRIVYLGLVLGIALNCFGASQSYADKFTDNVDRLLKEGTITEEQARKMLIGHVHETLNAGPNIDDLMSRANQLSENAISFRPRPKCDPKKDKGCSIM